MRKYLIGALAALTLIGVPMAHVAQATDDNPCGSLHDFKVEPLSGYTFTVPTPPAGWTVEFVVLKVGGPGGGTHITFDPASPGQVLDVSYQQYEISHAHVCKSRIPEETTTSTSTSTSTSTTTTTTEPATTTTTTVAQSSTTTDPATTTSTVAPSTTDASTSTSTTTVSPTTTGPTTTVQVGQPPVPPQPQQTVDDPPAQPVNLPSTGGEATLALYALVVVCLGIVLAMMARRPVA